MKTPVVERNTLPSIFTFTGSIALSDALMKIITHDQQELPILVAARGLLGMKSSDKNVNEMRRHSQNTPQTSPDLSLNPQTVDKAVIDHEGAEFMEVRYRMVVNANSLKPHACNNLDIALASMDFIRRYYALGGSRYLAERYISNILRGLWLHRNLEFRHDGEVQVTGFAFGVAPFTFTHRDLSTKTDFSAIAGSEQLVDLMASALDGSLKGTDGAPTPAFFDVKARIRVFPGMQVYPSQIMNMDDQGKKLAYLSTRQGQKQAIMHSQKVGNAIRSIDNWYQKPLIAAAQAQSPSLEVMKALMPKIADGSFELEALPVEPLGIERKLNLAYRMALDIDLYVLLRTLINDINVKLASATEFKQISDDMHYLAACFIRGGLFGGEKDTSEADVKKGKAKSGKQAA
jgi:CRISPR-associated protein Csy3